MKVGLNLKRTTVFLILTAALAYHVVNQGRGALGAKEQLPKAVRECRNPTYRGGLQELVTRAEQERELASRFNSSLIAGIRADQLDLGRKDELVQGALQGLREKRGQLLGVNSPQQLHLHGALRDVATSLETITGLEESEKAREGVLHAAIFQELAELSNRTAEGTLPSPLKAVAGADGFDTLALAAAEIRTQGLSVANEDYERALKALGVACQLSSERVIASK